MKLKRLISCLLSVSSILTVSQFSLPVKAEESICKLINGNHVLALTSDGKLFGWGDNSRGQLGIQGQKILQSDGSQIDGASLFAIYTPTEISFFKDNNISIKDIYCSDETSYVVSTDGTLWVAGSNSSYKLAIRSTVSNTKIWTRVADTGTASFKVGRVWPRENGLLVENIVGSKYLYACGQNSPDYNLGFTGSAVAGFTSVTAISCEFIENIYTTDKMTIIVCNDSNNRGVYFAGSPVYVQDGDANIQIHVDSGMGRANNTRNGVSSVLYSGDEFSQLETNASQHTFYSYYYNNTVYPLTDRLLYRSSYFDQSHIPNFDLTHNTLAINPTKYPLQASSLLLGGNVRWTKDRLIVIYNNQLYCTGIDNSKGQDGAAIARNYYKLGRTYIEEPHLTYNSLLNSSSFTISDLVCSRDINYLLIETPQGIRAYSNGDNSVGQLGISKLSNEVPWSSEANCITKLNNLSITKIVSNGYISYAVCRDGRVYAWGNNIAGACGQGDSSSSTLYYSEPVLVQNFNLYTGLPKPLAPDTIVAPKYAYIGTDATVTWSPVTDAVGYVLEYQDVDNPVWTEIPLTNPKVTSYTFSVVDKKDRIFRVAAINDADVRSEYTQSEVCHMKDTPIKPYGLTASPSYVKANATINLSMSLPREGIRCIIQRSIDDGKSWEQIGTATGTGLTDTANQYWTKVKYRVAQYSDVMEEELSGWTESNSVQIGQEMLPPKDMVSPTSVNADDEITISWSEPSILGEFGYKLYSSIDGGAFSLVDPYLEDTTYSCTANTTWHAIQFKLTTTDKHSESEGVLSNTIAVISPDTGGGSGGSIDWDSIMGSGGLGGVDAINPEDDGTAVSTLKAIEKLKTTVFKSTGATVNGGSLKLYAKYNSTGYEGLVLPVTFKSKVINKAVTGYLLFNGVQYPIHWTDMTGPTTIKNLTGVVSGFACVPITDMTTDGEEIPCELYIQDEGDSSGKRTYYHEMFTTGVDMA